MRRICLAIVLSLASSARADPDSCLSWVDPTSSRRPTGTSHTFEIRVPEHLTGETAFARVGRVFSQVGAKVLPSLSLYVRATDAQLDLAAKALAPEFRNTPEQARAWFRPADDVALLSGQGAFWVDTAVTPPEALAPPPDWTVAPSERPLWLVHFPAPMSQTQYEGFLGSVGPDADSASPPSPTVPGTVTLLRLTPAQASQLRRRPEVDWVGRYEAVWKLGASFDPGTATTCADRRGAMRALLTAAAADPKTAVELELELVPELDSPRFLGALDAAGGKVTASSQAHYRLTGPRALIRWLARRPEVLRIDLASTPEPA